MAAKAGAESEMKKRKKETVFEGIMAGAKEALAYARDEADASRYKVHIPEDLDVHGVFALWRTS
jgi:hypothetical protein